ncbi:MAG: putative selenate reductase subunit YgfK [Bacteroidales bacterium]|nr:putative selenate reductase subunit YgfK [Bacteroidales bacterium]
MNSEFSLISWRHLFELTMQGVEEKRVFDLPEALFYQPQKNNPLRTRMFDQPLENPVGISAGPHSQMAQNIVSAWLCGARYIELKTVQTDDELDIPRPCIDMPFEGYNCEFSQELKIHQSYDEYLNAWILIHILKDKFGWTKDIGTIFNMSIGYDLEGIKKNNVQWFLDKMSDCSKEKNEKLDAIADLYPRAKELDIPNCISDNVTLSTMHGCPPGEIRQIGEFLLKERGLHTFIKFNPTLLGPEKIRQILQDYGYTTPVPDEAFEHDIGYEEAVEVIESLMQSAKNENLHFGLKLTNTLESLNHKDVFEGDAMFMSGKALHPISINVARRLKNEESLQEVPVSFSGGVDAFNIADTTSCGLNPVTVSTDLLRPGGYGKLSQYIDILQKECDSAGAKSLEEYSKRQAGEENVFEAYRKNLNRYADQVLENPDYKAQSPSIYLERPLNHFDCIQAPCESTCPSGQNVPGYLYYAARGEYDKAFEVIMHDNPFPSVSGMICDHECQTRCTRVLYDDPLLIREIKRFIAENSNAGKNMGNTNGNHGKVAIIGAGPSGLSCAYYLALAGFSVEIFESREEAGGMVSETIPSFRLSETSLKKDIERIRQMGVTIHYGTKVNREKFRELKSGFDFIYIAVGAQKSKNLSTDGVKNVTTGLVAPLELLSDIKSNRETSIGKNIVVLGGGNVALDVARTAKRLASKEGSVKLVYRRTRSEMPADPEELEEALEEGVEWTDLANPAKVITDNGRITSMKFRKMKIEGKDQSGRPKPVPDGDKEFALDCDTVIPAFGQEVEPEFREFINKQGASTEESENVLIGGDAKRGASTLIKAIADGKFAAWDIMKRKGVKPADTQRNHVEKDVTLSELQYNKARVERGMQMNKRSPEERNDFSLVIQPLSADEVQQEASRCMYCDELCNICVDVCPNRANHSYEIEPFAVEIPHARKENGRINVGTSGIYRIEQRYQVLNIKDFCNECGNCETFCPSSGAPFRDKPQLHLTEKSFKETEEGFHFYDGKLFMKKEGHQQSLQKKGNTFHYESEKATARFRTKDFYPEKVTLTNSEEMRFDDAIKMSIIYEAAKELSVRT